MTALEITNIKTFMSAFLKDSVFFIFDFVEADITTFNHFHLDGFHQKEYFDEGENFAEYASWQQLQSISFDLIKGKKLPLSFKFVLRLNHEHSHLFLQKNNATDQEGQLQGLYLNIRYEQGTLMCISGTSFKSFSLDKSLETAWDREVMAFFTTQELNFEIR